MTKWAVTTPGSGTDPCCCAPCCFYKIDPELDPPYEFDDSDLPDSVYVALCEQWAGASSAEFSHTGAFTYTHPSNPSITLTATPDGWKLTTLGYIAYGTCLYQELGGVCNCYAGTFEITCSASIITPSFEGSPYTLDNPPVGGISGTFNDGDLVGSWSHNFGTEEDPDIKSGTFRVVINCIFGDCGDYTFIGLALADGSGEFMGVHEGWAFQGSFCKPNEDGTVTVSNGIAGGGTATGSGMYFDPGSGYNVTSLYEATYILTLEGDEIELEYDSGCVWKSADGEHILFFDSSTYEWRVDGNEKSDGDNSSPVGNYGDGGVVSIPE